MHNFQILLLVILISQKTQSQCITYPSIDGAVCQECQPIGWAASIGTPDIVDPLVYQAACVDPAPPTSPSGGNASQFVVPEAMQTTVVGLTDGQEYYLAFWYTSVDCIIGSICCASLEIRVDGTVTSFPTVGDWTLAELCVVANGSTMEIELAGIPDPSFIGTLLVDDADCDVNFMPSFDPIFSFEDSLCRNTGFVELDSFTIDGILGEWTVPRFNTDTIFSDSLKSIWTPVSTDYLCSTEKKFTFHIYDMVTPVFDFPVVLCESDNTFILPELSNNSVPGTWTISLIDPTGLGGMAISTTFIPFDNTCANRVTIVINIVQELLPEFDLRESLCKSDALLLPNLSDNSILGSWTINPIDASGISTTSVTTFFQPDEECYADYELTIQIENVESPDFDLPSYLCSTDVVFIYPSVSSNGIIGNWDITQITPSDNIGQEVVATFFPHDSFCSESISSSITIPPSIDWSIASNGPTSCNTTDGQIVITSSIQELEISLDNINWQTSDFDQLSPGNFTVYVRVTNYPLCVESTLVSVPSINLPDITNIEVTDVSSCAMSNGELLINADGNNLEYSLDSIVWQDSNLFENLPAGAQQIFVRSLDFMDCIVDSVSIISAPSLVQLLDVIPTDLTSCVFDNGEIEIIATGNNLEYTIDGVIWQDSNFFQGLSSDTYIVSVRNQIQTDCYDDQEVIIHPVPIVQLDSVSVSQPSLCSPLSGQINIAASGNNLEYSIDNGVNYSFDNIYSDLQAGSYSIIVRNNLIPDCYDTAIVTISLLEDELPQRDISIEPLTDCRTNDGKLIIELDSLNLEYTLSLDSTWQSSNVFENLAPGSYTLYVRDSINIDCQTTLDFDIEDIDCPCLDLVIAASVIPSGCLEASNGTISIEEIVGQQFDIDSLIWENQCCGLLLEELVSGWYYYTVYYDSTCVWIDSILVEALDPFTFGLNSYDSDCQGDNDGVIEVLDVSGNSGVISYSLGGVEYQDSSIFYNLSPGEYAVFVQDQVDCIESQNTVIDDGAFLSYALSASETIQLGDSIYLNPLINEETIDSFKWAPSSGILNLGNLIALVSPNTTTQYDLTVYYGECKDIITILIEVESNSEDLYLANVFTPLANENNYFFPQAKVDSEIVLINLSIYDRWGNKLFSNDNLLLNNPQDGWDGLHDGRRVMPGVYVFVIQYMKNGEIIVNADDLTIFW